MRGPIRPTFSDRASETGGLGWPRRARRAMTFLEIMVVVVILGVLIALTGARMKGTSQRAALAGAARELVAACHTARQAAISTQREVWLKFDVNSDRWRIELNVDPSEEDRRARHNRDARYDLERINTLPPKISFAEVTTSADAFRQDRRDEYPLIIFRPDGSATGSAVVLQSERGRKMTVQVSAGTGRPEAYEGEPRDFSEKLADLGVSPEAFGLQPEGFEGLMHDPHGQAATERRDREARQREDHYRSALSRLMEARGLGPSASESWAQPGGRR